MVFLDTYSTFAPAVEGSIPAFSYDPSPYSLVLPDADGNQGKATTRGYVAGSGELRRIAAHISPRLSPVPLFCVCVRSSPRRNDWSLE